MTPLILLAMLGVGFGAFALSGGSDEADTPEPEKEPVVEPADEEPEAEEPDVGVSFVVDGDTISIDVGEDETGSVVAIRTELLREDVLDADDVANPHQMNGYQETTHFGVEFFLVPKGSDSPPVLRMYLPLQVRTQAMLQRTAPREWPTKITSPTWALNAWAVSIWEALSSSIQPVTLTHR
ncbi:hypothetical protein ABMC88_09425 [Sulfitobacter sp. HNIBRBA2951]|uniref:hypothetical protein n=1 Tax=Sulfitobacter aquimarinus TaxID=3158557 RepID=UPI0032DE5645